MDEEGWLVQPSFQGEDEEEAWSKRGEDEEDCLYSCLQFLESFVIKKKALGLTHSVTDLLCDGDSVSSSVRSNSRHTLLQKTPPPFNLSA